MQDPTNDNTGGGTPEPTVPDAGQQTPPNPGWTPPASGGAPQEGGDQAPAAPTETPAPEGQTGQ